MNGTFLKITTIISSLTILPGISLASSYYTEPTYAEIVNVQGKTLEVEKSGDNGAVIGTEGYIVKEGSTTTVDSYAGNSVTKTVSGDETTIDGSEGNSATKTVSGNETTIKISDGDNKVKITKTVNSDGTTTIDAGKNGGQVKSKTFETRTNSR